MNFITRFFSYKKVASIKIHCTIPHGTGDAIRFEMTCKLYENKNGDRKANMPTDMYPLTNIITYKDLVTRFLKHQCTSEIPPYSKIIAGEPPLELEDRTAIH